MAEQYSTVWIDHIFVYAFICYGNLGYFHLCDVTNNAALDVTWVHGYLSPCVYLGVELLGHVVLSSLSMSLMSFLYQGRQLCILYVSEPDNPER